MICVCQLCRNDLLLLIDEIYHDCTLYGDEIRDNIVLRGGSLLSVQQVNYYRRKLGFRRGRVWIYAREAQIAAELIFFVSISTYTSRQLVFLDESAVSTRHTNRHWGYHLRLVCFENFELILCFFVLKQRLQTCI